jgi:hypothetical protein
MVEAVHTLASPLDIWIMVVVMVVLLAFWLSAIMVADQIQVRASGHSGDPIENEALGAPPANAGLPGRHVRSENVPEEYEIDEYESDTQTRPDVIFTPPRPTGPARPASGYAMPAQRSGDADRAERSHAGPPPSRDDETGR